MGDSIYYSISLLAIEEILQELDTEDQSRFVISDRCGFSAADRQLFQVCLRFAKIVEQLCDEDTEFDYEAYHKISCF